MSDVPTKTKELIFDAFVEMTSELGYENVSMRDIANKVGIQVASIYNHYKTKNSMLEYAYEFHARRQYENRVPIEKMKKLIETADTDEIVKNFIYTYESDVPKQYIRVVLITKIIYMRLFQDPLANANFSESNRDNTDYIIEIMQHGINVGRIDPTFDIVAFADVMLGALQAMAIKAFSDTNYVVGQLNQEQRIRGMISRLLTSALIG
ncbi:MAG: TetR/AcrR family transcriptional regulator [Oscillospiraceae bacterium]|nr:TetR/AcrR family transcriptional regulator [Oscillospiraceae bacterium]